VVDVYRALPEADRVLIAPSVLERLASSGLAGPAAPDDQAVTEAACDSQLTSALAEHGHLARQVTRVISRTAAPAPVEVLLPRRSRKPDRSGRSGVTHPGARSCGHGSGAASVRGHAGNAAGHDGTVSFPACQAGLGKVAMTVPELSCHK